MPESMNCTLGVTKYLYEKELTPLVVACKNYNIPIHIIEFLLKNKANPNIIYEWRSSLSYDHYNDVEILQGLRYMDKERYEAIVTLFKKYGYTGTIWPHEVVDTSCL